MQTTTGLAKEALRAGAAGRGALFVHVAQRRERYFRGLIPDRAEAEECMQRTLFFFTGLRYRRRRQARGGSPADESPVHAPLDPAPPATSAAAQAEVTKGN